MQAVGCLGITVYYLICVLLKDNMSEGQHNTTSRISLFFSYLTMFSVDQAYNCYLQSNMMLIPSNLQFMVIECQFAIAMSFT
jgi:hypothetical protein